MGQSSGPMLVLVCHPPGVPLPPSHHITPQTLLPTDCSERWCFPPNLSLDHSSKPPSLSSFHIFHQQDSSLLLF